MANPWERNYRARSSKEMFGSPDQNSLPSTVEDTVSRARLSQADPQKLRSSLQGLTLEFWDELEAFARSNWNKAAGGETDYETIRNEIRNKIEDYRRANPGEALTYEVLGAIAPTVAMLLVPGGQGAGISNISANLAKIGKAGIEAGKASNLFKGVGSNVLKGMTEGAVGSYGASEKESFLDSTGDILTGAGVGGGMSGGLSIGGRALSVVGNTFFDAVTSLFGAEGKTIVARKLKEIVERTGSTPDEAIAKIMRGELLAEDPGLNALVKVIREQGGEPARRLNAVLDYKSGARSRRVLSTERAAQEELQTALVPSQRIDNNLVDYFNLDDEAAKLAENQSYRKVFDTPINVNSELFQDITDLLKGNRTIQKAIEDIYASNPNMKKFFAVDAKTGKMKIDSKGRVVLKGTPTIEDAENIKRALDTTIDDYYKMQGTGSTVATNLKNRLQPFVNKLDAFSPELAAVRSDAALLRSSRQAYKEAQTDLGKQNQEEVISRINKYLDAAENGSPDELNAYRLGMMTAIKNKFVGREDIARALSTPGTKEYQILSRIVPENQLDDVISKLEVSAQSRRSISKMAGGSDTQEKLAAETFMNRPVPAQAITAALKGDFSMAIPALIGMFKPGLNERQKSELTRLLLADKDMVELVKRSLYDEGALGVLQNRVNALSRVAFGGFRREASIDPVQTTTGILDLLNLP